MGPAFVVPPGQYRVLAANDLGMHCMDREFSTFSILPPFNVVKAQVIYRTPAGLPQVLGPGQVKVTYSPVADVHGSINSRSIGKTDFWTFVHGLFGATLPPGMGVTGLYMPADAPIPGPQDIAWEPSAGVFRAFGLPITPIDDAGNTNPYPLMRIEARSIATNAVLASTDVVVPVSGETDCRNCHETGTMAANQSGIAWSTNPDAEIRAKQNVLILHDLREGTGLRWTTPVLCASCHTSPPLELSPNTSTAVTASALPDLARGTAKPPLMSAVMHSYHGRLLTPSGQHVFPPGGTPLQTCYQCHPGAITECLRGAMKTGGMDCYSCHGDMLATGGAFPLASGGSLDGLNDGHGRRPWMDLPRCQSCHTGDALTHVTGVGVVPAADGIRLRQAWRTGDNAASAISAPTSRFAENPGQLYRNSKGHGQVSCEGCHGSTHAEWPNVDPTANDNVAANQIQGHTGTIVECNACHASGTLALTMNGPHGMHNVDSASFVHDHGQFYEQNSQACRACHGVNLQGTVLSRAAANRSYVVEGATVNIPKGTQIGCTLCHGAPGTDD